MTMTSNIPTTTASSQDRRARIATCVVFFVHAALFASWTPHIPLVAARLHLSTSALGTALLGAPTGSVLAMTASGALITRWGSAAIMRLTLIGYCLVGAALGLATSQVSLFAALGAWGLFQGSLDVAMNAHAGSVEVRYRRSIFASFHACWSAGAFAGTGLGSVSIALGIPLGTHMLGLGAILTAIALPVTWWSLPAGDDRTTATSDTAGLLRHFARPTPALLGLGCIICCGLLCEGASADWTALYLHTSLAVPVQLAGAGYAAFAVAMFLGRLIGDRAIAALGPRAVVRVGTSIAALALALGLGLNLPASAIIGFGLLGLGLSVVVPAVLSASGRLPGLAPAPALAMTTAFGWIGFVAGPPFIGLLASVTGLRAALGLLPLLCLIMTALTLVVPMPPLQTQPNISPPQQIACPSKRK